MDWAFAFQARIRGICRTLSACARQGSHCAILAQLCYRNCPPYSATPLTNLWPPVGGLGPKLGKRMRDAIGVRAGGANIATVEYEAIVDVFPVSFWNQRFQVFRDLRKVLIVSKVEALGEALHMRVRRYSLPDIIELAKDDVGSLVADTLKRL